MAETVLVQLDKKLTPVRVTIYDDVQRRVQFVNDSQQSQQKLQSAKEVIVLLPASWVYLTHSQVPSRLSEVLKQSIPYSIEDELANEVEANDYAWFSHSDQLHSVAVINIDKRQALYRWIKSQKLPVKAIYSELAFCPVKDDCLSIWCEDTRSLVRFGMGSSMVCEINQLPELVQAFADNLSQLWSNKPLDNMPQSLAVQPALTAADCCSYLVDEPPEPNLFKPELMQESSKSNQKSGRIVAVLGLAVILSWAFISGYQAYQLSASVGTIKVAQQKLMTDAFGSLSITEQNDPFAALQSRLKQNKQNNRLHKNSLLDGFYYMGESRRQIPQVVLKGMRLFDNQLEIQINAPSIAVVNQFQQQLQNNAIEYNINIGVNESSDGIYQSILTMKPR